MVGERAEDRRTEARVVGVRAGGLRRREPARHVRPQRVVRRRLVGDDVELDTVVEKPGDNVGRVAQERDRARPVRIQVRGERVVVFRDDVHPAVTQAAARRARVDLDDERAPAVPRHAEALRAAHSAQAGGEHAPPRERAAEVGLRDRAEGLVGKAEDALRADVEPPGRGHLPVHRQARVLEPAERVLVRPGRHDHRRRDEHPRRVLVRRQHGDRLPGLDDERLVGAEPLERGDDAGERLLVARRAAATAVDDERRGVLGDLGIEVVEQAAQRAFLLPATAAKLAHGAIVLAGFA